MRVKTDLAEATFKRFDLRQAVEMPEMLFTVSKVDGADGQAEFVFLGRGWGHGVGMCQNGAFGMALAGPDLRPDPAPLLHRHRHRPGVDGHRPGSPVFTLTSTAFVAVGAALAAARIRHGAPEAGGDRPRPYGTPIPHQFRPGAGRGSESRRR